MQHRHQKEAPAVVTSTKEAVRALGGLEPHPLDRVAIVAAVDLAVVVEVDAVLTLAPRAELWLVPSPGSPWQGSGGRSLGGSRIEFRGHVHLKTK